MVDSKPHDQPNPVAASVADVYVDMCDTFLVCNMLRDDPDEGPSRNIHIGQAVKLFFILQVS